MKKLVFGIFGLLAIVAAAAPVPVDFGREVFPILQRACFECHGAEQQKAKLRLDDRDAAFQSAEVIVKGDAARSELYQRVILPKGHDDVMPNRGEPLTKGETEIIRRWIEAGATWPDEFKSQHHWAYVKPERPTVPQIGNPQFTIRNPIDAFVVERLQNEGMQQSPEADRATLLRRVTLDLIGLPPTPAEVTAFLNDKSADAYEKVVNRLLASEQFGVRWARPWLDLARYADSHGFQRDDLRDVWPYRDWVIDALNADMPFDRFTIEQLAGDLMPNATDAQRIATGFNRCTPTNVEAGSEPEETRINQVFDRVNTLGAVLLGVTLECAQCHDHKYDPIPMKDYYRLMAFFNNTEKEAERTNPKVPGSIQFIGPYYDLKDMAKDAEREQLKQQQAKLKAGIAAREEALDAQLDAFETDLVEAAKSAAQTHVLTVKDFDSTGGADFKLLEDGSVLVTGETPDNDTYIVKTHTTVTDIGGIKIEALTHDSLPGKGPGLGDEARPNFVLNNLLVTAAPSDGSAKPQPVKFVRATSSFSQGNFPVANLLKDNGNDRKTGWAISPKFHEDHWATFECASPLGFPGGTEITFKLVQHFGGARTIGRLRVSAITGKLGGDSIPAAITQVLTTPKVKRTKAQSAELAKFQAQRDSQLATLREELRKVDLKLLGQKRAQTLVMQELDQPRASTMFNRGVYTDKGEPVEPGVPVALHPLKISKPTSQNNRLDLGQWLVDRENPLVARVTVNRWWAELFGRGIVSTVEDFGIKGDRPTHPELLDWLAVEFMDNGWSMKKLLKTIVVSATYRQSSRLTPEAFERDDQNKLLARGPRHRMDAEMIRDNALSIAGLLSLKQGGPPIRPPQPDGLWIKLGGQKYDYQISPGEEKYRRGLYVVLKRGAPYPSFVNFDASSRMACTVKRSRSNTPLQALTLLNDPVYVEAAMAFAKRILTEAPQQSAEARITHAFAVAVGRTPRDAEMTALKNLITAQRDAAAKDAKGTKELIGGLKLPAGVAPEEFAAWYAVATALLNLDETITKG